MSNGRENRDMTVFPKNNESSPGSVELIKYGVDENDERSPLDNVTFRLFSASDPEQQYPIKVKDGKVSTDSNASIDLRTNAEGKIIIDQLSPGKYYFREEKTVPGYQLNQEPQNFTVKSDERTVIEMDNFLSEYGGVRLRKIDNQPFLSTLEGAAFKITTLTNENGNEVYEPVRVESEEYISESDSYGMVDFTDLSFGTYYIFETRAPYVNGVQYQLLSKPIRVDITSESYFNEPIDVVNRPEPKAPDVGGEDPPDEAVIIPQTGDPFTTILIGLGIILFVSGYYYYRK